MSQVTKRALEASLKNLLLKKPLNKITINDIANINCDYVALGHVHKGSKVDYVNGTAYAYPGCIEGRSFDECGKKYAIA